MQRWLLATGLLLGFAASAAAGEAKWIRYPAISPDGTRIAFSTKGDLWVVSVDGGEARPLTSHTGYEKMPVWSPDGQWIAFASDRHGNFDVFVVASAGGRARRLTFHSAADLPSDFTRDGKNVLFSSTRLDAPSAIIGTPWFRLGESKNSSLGKELR